MARRSSPRTSFAIWNPAAVLVALLLLSQLLPSIGTMVRTGSTGTLLGNALRVVLGILVLLCAVVMRERVRLDEEGIRRGLTIGRTALVPWRDLAVARVELLEHPHMIRRLASWGRAPIAHLVYARRDAGWQPGQELVGRRVRVPRHRVTRVLEWCDAFAEIVRGEDSATGGSSG